MRKTTLTIFSIARKEKEILIIIGLATLEFQLHL